LRISSLTPRGIVRGPGSRRLLRKRAGRHHAQASSGKADVTRQSGVAIFEFSRTAPSGGDPCGTASWLVVVGVRTRHVPARQRVISHVRVIVIGMRHRSTMAYCGAIRARGAKCSQFVPPARQSQSALKCAEFDGGIRFQVPHVEVRWTAEQINRMHEFGSTETRPRGRTVVDPRKAMPPKSPASRLAGTRGRIIVSRHVRLMVPPNSMTYSGTGLLVYHE